MTCTGKIITTTPSDFAVRGGSFPYFGCSAASEDPAVKCVITLFSGNSALSDSKPSLSMDYRLRNPISLFATRVDLVPGDYRVTSSVSSGAGAAQDTAAIKIFDTASSVVSVANQGQLNTALQNIKNQSATHVKILIASGTYVYPTGSSYDLSAQDKLVTFEALGSAYFTGTNPFNVKWASWVKVSFTNPAGTAFSAQIGSHHAFRRCQFSGAATALIASAGSYVRVEDCHMHSVTTGFVNVAIVRGLSWTKVSGVVFHNCPVIESTTGRRNISTNAGTGILKRQCVWALYDGPLTNVVIRENLVLDDYSTIILSDSLLTNAAIVGNTFVTTGVLCIQLGSLANSCIINNTLISPSTTPSISVTGSSFRTAVVNNFATMVESAIRKIADTGYWSNNAFETAPRIGSNYVIGDPRFENSYKFLSIVSPIREAGASVGGILTIQGLPIGKQIGSMPYHVDIGLQHIYANMRSDSLFGFSMPAVIPT